MPGRVHIIPIYDYPIIFCTDIRSAVKCFSEKYDLSLQDARTYIEAFGPGVPCSGWCNVIRNDDDETLCGIICVSNRSDLNTIAHEAAHMALRILDFVGVEVTLDNDEPLAFLVGYLVEEFKKPWS